MPTTKDNVSYNASVWNNYDWKNKGEEWSESWGGSFMQWYGTIFPRIKVHTPADRILEIACGYGRWTHYLKDLCQHLDVVDLSEECILACKQRFSASSHIEYHVNDGKSLSMIPDGSIDFAFSFDSLVHTDDSVMEAYISELSRVLSPNGVAFIHHSNFGGELQRPQSKLEMAFFKLFGLLEAHNRDPSVSAEKVNALAEKCQLKCISQEIVPWGSRGIVLTDCMSTIVQSDSPLARNNQVLRNKNFMKEAQSMLQLSRLYDVNPPI